MQDLLNKQFLTANLCWIYRLMVASAPLLEFALIHCSKGPLFDFYYKHLQEERGHDEMLAQDLVGMGVEKIPVSMSAARLAGSQYYLIAHHHPCMLLGYMQALENQSFSTAMVDELEKAHECKLSCLRHHATHDPEHSADLELQVVSLSPRLLKDVISNRNLTNLSIYAEATIWRKESNG